MIRQDHHLTEHFAFHLHKYMLPCETFQPVKMNTKKKPIAFFKPKARMLSDIESLILE